MRRVVTRFSVAQIAELSATIRPRLSGVYGHCAPVDHQARTERGPRGGEGAVGGSAGIQLPFEAEILLGFIADGDVVHAVALLAREIRFTSD